MNFEIIINSLFNTHPLQTKISKLHKKNQPHEKGEHVVVCYLTNAA